MVSNIIAPVATMFSNASGINPFNPRFINWSYLKRGSVHRIHMNIKIRMKVFVINEIMPPYSRRAQPDHVDSSTNGIS